MEIASSPSSSPSSSEFLAIAHTIVIPLARPYPDEVDEIWWKGVSTASQCHMYAGRTLAQCFKGHAKMEMSRWMSTSGVRSRFPEVVARWMLHSESHFITLREQNSSSGSISNSKPLNATQSHSSQATQIPWSEPCSCSNPAACGCYSDY